MKVWRKKKCIERSLRLGFSAEHSVPVALDSSITDSGPDGYGCYQERLIMIYSMATVNFLAEKVQSLLRFLIMYTSVQSFGVSKTDNNK